MLALRRFLALGKQLFVHIIELQYIHQCAGQELRIAIILDSDLLHHLPHNHFDVLIRNVNALQTVHSLHFTKHIILYSLDSLDL